LALVFYALISSNTDVYGNAPFNNIRFRFGCRGDWHRPQRLFIELGHIIGCKFGHYDITSVNILGLNFKKQENGKYKFSFSEFDGFTGETKYVPEGCEKSNPRHIIYMPLVFLLIEVIALAVLIAFGPFVWR
jgi:hypothetical protein